MLDQVDVAVFFSGSDAGPLTVQIRNVLPDGTPSGAVLATATVPQTSFSTTVPPGFVPVPLSPPVPSVAGTKYAIVLGAPLATSGSYHWAYGGNNPYPAGMPFVSTTSGVTWDNPQPSLDEAFRTYVDSTVPVVPEAPLALLFPIAGLAVLGAGVVLPRWRRRGSEPN